MAVLIASDLAKDMAGDPLLRGVSFKLERSDRMTLSGRNGAGKTTLLRMLAGEASVDGGELVWEKGAKVALHDQRPPRERDISLRDYVVGGAKELVAVEGELARLEQRMAEGDAGEATLAAYADAQGALEHAGGYAWRDRALQTVHGLGFADEQLDRSLRSFSGGELTRASLARALAGRPDLLLLDEPTNHLDIESLEWLEAHLKTIDAAVVLVAHDRWFLEAVGTSVLELEAGRARFFKGPWHAWRREQAARELALGRAIERQHREIARMERFVERFRYKATKARQAQSRVKKLEKMERITRADHPHSAGGARRDGKGLEFEFKPPERSGRVVFELEDVRLEVPGRTLLDGGELWLERGEHVSLVGPNGAGKTSLIEAIAGRRELDGGRRRMGHNVKLGYLSQHAEELEAGNARTALEATAKRTGLTPNAARALLGRFLFSGDEAEKPLEGLSGGERRRLTLAILVASGANVLVLDEPTNHLDLESREALEDALRAFPGSLLLVSHDRALLDAVGSRTVALEEGRLRSYVGGWPEYARVREERRGAPARALGPASSSAPSSSSSSGSSSSGSSSSAPSGSSSSGSSSSSTALPRGRRTGRAPSKNEQRRQADLEAEIERAEAELERLEEELADPAAWAGPERTEQSAARHAAAQERLEALYARWEQRAAAAS